MRMIRSLDDVAASASGRIVAWTCSRVDASRREWVEGMASELEAIEGGWRKLRWAIEGLPLAWALAKPGSAMDELQSRRPTMSGQQQGPWRPVVDSFVLNVAMLIGWWLALTMVIRATFPKGLTDSGEVVILGALVVGLIASLAFRRLGAAYVFAGLIAYAAIEAVYHSMGGIRVVQGAAAHFGNMLAGILAATFAALIENRRDEFAGGIAWSARNPIAPLLNAGLAARRKLGYASHLIFALSVFVFTQVVIRTLFGLLWMQPTGTFHWRHIFNDGMTNYAMLFCAIVCAGLGVLVASWGDRLAIPLRGRPQTV